MTDSPTPQLAGHSSRNVNWTRRNWCAAAILGLYFAVNAVGFYLAYSISPNQISHNLAPARQLIVGLGLALTVAFFAASWFWAKAKNYPGGIGTSVALVGMLLWLGSSVAVVYPSIERDIPGTTPVIPTNNWLPLMPWVAFIFTAVVLKMLPVRKTVAAPVTDAA